MASSSKKPGEGDKYGINLDILLMGVTGHGKSATGNTILMREEFISEGGWGSVTKDYHVGITAFGERTIKVVDIPGFSDTDEESPEAKQALVIKALSKALAKFPNGFHAVLLVVSYAIRLTKDVQDTLEFVLNKFDEDAFKKYGVLVVTNGDAFLRDSRKNKYTLGLWMKLNCPKLFDMCSKRCVLVNNVADDPIEKEQQAMQILHQIDCMDNKKDRHIPLTCRYSGEDTKSFENDRKKVAEHEEISDCLGLLKDRLLDFEKQPGKASSIELKNEIDLAKKKVKSSDTASVKSLEKVLNRIENVVENSAKDKKEMVKNVDMITDAQKDLDKENESGDWWENTVNGVTDFIQAVNPAVGLGVKAVKSVMSWLGW